MLGFLSPTPLYNIILNAAYKKTCQTLSEFQTGSGAAAHATLQASQNCVGTITFLKVSDWEFIPVLEVHDLLSKIHDIVVKSEMYHSHLWTTERELFLLVRLGFLVGSSGICHRLSSTHHLDHHSIQPLGVLNPFSVHFTKNLIYRQPENHHDGMK